MGSVQRNQWVYDLEAIDRPAARFEFSFNGVEDPFECKIVEANEGFIQYHAQIIGANPSFNLFEYWKKDFAQAMHCGIYLHTDLAEKMEKILYVETAVRTSDNGLIAVFCPYAEMLEWQSLKAIGDYGVDHVVRFDTKGRYIYVNPAVEKIIGKKAEDYIGKTPAEMNFNPLQVKLWEDSIQEVVATKQVKRMEIEITLNGEQLSRDWILTPELTEQQEVVSIISVSRDFSVHRKERERQKEFTEELEELVRERTFRLEELNSELEEMNALLESEILENKKMMEQLRSTTNELDDIYNNAPIGYHTLDKEGRFLRINNVELDWLGYRREEVIGKMTIFDFTSPQMRDLRAYQEILERIEKDELRDVEAGMTCKDGSRLPVIVNTAVIRDSDGKIVKTRSTIFNNFYRKAAEDQLKEWNNHLENLVQERTHDLIESNEGLEEMNAQLEEVNAQLEEEIAEKTVAQEALVESERQFRRAIEKAPVPILLFANNGSVLLMNQALEDVSGYTAQDMQTIFDFAGILNIGEEKLSQWLGSIYEARNENVKQEVEFSSRLGVKKIVEITPALLGRLEDGREFGMIVAIDLTAIRGSERSLINARNEAESANKAKSVFLANMSHEIRTPLNGIIGMTNLLLWTQINEEQREYIQLALKSGNILLSVVNDILDYSKIEAGMERLTKVSFNIREAVREVIDLFEISARSKALHMNCQIEDNLPTNVVGDSMKFRQILANLIGNAVKFTNIGEVKISIRRGIDRKGRVRVDFEISDTGIGIPEGKQELLFKSFSQVDSSYTKKFRGTGLGLAIVKNLIELMEGEIEVNSVEGVGSCFKFFVSLDADIDNKSLENEYNGSHHQESKKKHSEVKVLLAEDDEIGRLVVCGYLEKIGCEVTAVTNGEEVFEQFKRERYQLVLMDLQMPVVDGFTAVKNIRRYEDKLGTYTPIIALTAYAFESDRTKCLQSGMDDYLSKPLAYEEFEEKVTKWIKV